MHSHDYDSLVEAQQGLIANGYKEGFVYKDGKMFTADKSKSYSPGDLISVEEYRFEGMSNPGDESIVFALRANDGTKGYAFSSYGPQANEQLVKFLSDIRKEDSPEVANHP